MAVSLKVIAEGPLLKLQSKKYIKPTLTTVGKDNELLNSQLETVVLSCLLVEFTKVNDPLNWIFLTFILVEIGVVLVPIIRLVFTKVVGAKTGHCAPDNRILLRDNVKLVSVKTPADSWREYPFPVVKVERTL